MIAPFIIIPPGLEQAYGKVVNQVGGVNPDTISAQKFVAKKRSYSTLALQSFFVMWQDLYNGLPLLFKNNWTTYWTSLPFGSHGGLHGYPGSGFSAFVYLNAPRYRQGLELILNPYPNPNLVYNGDFLTNADGWTLLYSAHWSMSRINFDASNSFSQTFLDTSHRMTLTIGTTYRVECDYNLVSGSGSFYVNRGTGTTPIFTKLLSIGTHHISETFTVPSGLSNYNLFTPFFGTISNSVGWFTNVSVVEL